MKTLHLVVELVTSIIVYCDDQSESGAERHNSGYRRRPRALSVLNFHPAVHVIACERDDGKRYVDHDGNLRLAHVKCYLIYKDVKLLILTICIKVNLIITHHL